MSDGSHNYTTTRTRWDFQSGSSGQVTIPGGGGPSLISAPLASTRLRAGGGGPSVAGSLSGGGASAIDAGSWAFFPAELVGGLAPGPWASLGGFDGL